MDSELALELLTES